MTTELGDMTAGHFQSNPSFLSGMRGIPDNMQRSCFADPDEEFPQARYYLNPLLRRKTAYDAPSVDTHLFGLQGRPKRKTSFSHSTSVQQPAMGADSSSGKFGAWDGVFVSCLLNIFGVIMFLRLGFVVGQAGVWSACLIILMSGVVTSLTTMSMSAIATNGEIREGGAYYMISRALGPAIGGAIGVLFALGMAIAVSMYVIGFCETLVSNVGVMTNSEINDIRLYGVVLTTVLLVCVLIGIGWVIKLQFVLIGLLVLAILSFFLGSFINEPSDGFVGVEGFGDGTFVENFTGAYKPMAGDPDFNFFTAFGIFFPAVTGIMAGANISGDLRDPSYDIPVGTLAAVLVSTIVYMLMAVFCAAVAKQDELVDNYLVMSEISAWSPLILCGIYAATLSSALTSLVGSPRVFLTIARDDLIPALSVFAHTNEKGEPIRAYFFAYAVAIGCVLIGDLNFVAPLITMFFLGTYAFISFACFQLSNGRSPGWRPTFRYYNKYFALLGGFICVAIMFMVDVMYTVAAVAIGAGINRYIAYRDPSVNWGSAFESNAKYNANQAVLRLQTRKDHVKNFQPSYLYLSGNPGDRPELVSFARSLKHGFGVNVFANVVKTGLGALPKGGADDYYLPPALKLRGFRETVAAPDLRQGARALMQLAGLGALRPNTVVLGFKHDWCVQAGAADEKETFPEVTVADYVGVLADALTMRKGIMVCAGLDRIMWGEKYTPSSEDGVHADVDSEEDSRKKSFIYRGRKRKLRRSSSCVESMSLLRALPSEDEIIVTDDPALAKHQEIEDYLLASPARSEPVVSASLEQVPDESKMYVDIWWLLDDGGLSLLVPHVMMKSSFWRSTKVQQRLFVVSEDLDQRVELRSSLGAKIGDMVRAHKSGVQVDSVTDEGDLWRMELQQLVQKFRMNMKGPIELKATFVEPEDVTMRAFLALVQNQPVEELAELEYDELVGLVPEKIRRWLRISELIRQHSTDQACVYVTAPDPRRFPQSQGGRDYMAVLHILSTGLNTPVVFIRGNSTNVLTFYSE